MKTTKLAKEKRNQLLLVLVGTVVVVSALGFGLIHMQYERIRGYVDDKILAEAKLQQMEEAIKRSGQMDQSYTELSAQLAEREAGMASGDLYSWMLNTVRRFQKNYKVEIPQLSPISAPVDNNLLPRFPYKQATMQIAGTAYYHDFGRFIADFENTFPLFRVVNVDIDLNSALVAGDREKLAFKLDVIALVKSSRP